MQSSSEPLSPILCPGHYSDNAVGRIDSERLNNCHFDHFDPAFPSIKSIAAIQQRPWITVDDNWW